MLFSPPIVEPMHIPCNKFGFCVSCIKSKLTLSAPSIFEEPDKTDFRRHVIWSSGGQCCLRRGRTFIFSWPWPYFYYIIFDDSHSYSIHPVQCNSERFRLLHDTKNVPLPIMRLLQPSLGMKVYNVGAHRLRETFEVTDRDTLNTCLTHSCLHLADIGWNHLSNSCKRGILSEKFRYISSHFVPFASV